MAPQEVINRIYMHGKTMTQDEALVIIESLKRQTPQKPNYLHKVTGVKIGYCPVCGHLVGEDVQYNHEYSNYCDCCGQKILWE